MTTDGARQRLRRADLVERLRAAVGGEVSASALRRAEYSSDASNYRVVPRVVVFPRDVDDILGTAEIARETGTPLTMRGAGTSVAGNAVGPGIVLDTSRHLNRVLAIDPEARSAVVEPGTVLDTLQRAAGPHGLRFGPDPSTHARCTVGGMIGNNACGSHAIAYGRTSDNVLALDVLDGAGRRFLAGRDAATAQPGGAVTARYRDAATAQPGGDAVPAATGVSSVPGLAEMVRLHLATIRTELGRFGRQVSGYSLEHLLPEHGGDVARALVGTEGTCALVLGATVGLVRPPAAHALAVLGYPDMATAADAVPALLGHGPLAVEGIDARIVDVVRRHKGSGAVPELPRGGGWLLVETGGDSPEHAYAAARRLAVGAGTRELRVVPAGAEAARLWRIREDGAGLAGRTAAGEQAWPGWEDAAVPPERLGRYLRELEELLAEHGIEGLAYGHFGDGCVHLRLNLPLAGRPERMRPFLLDAARLVAAHGGSLSGEHGDGRARSELLPEMYSPNAIAAFAAFKAVFDPHDLLNPAVVVRPRAVDDDLRRPVAHPLPLSRRPGGMALREDGGDLTNAVHRCVGVGKCRADNSAAGGFMCPSFLATGDETDSTRGRARVLQELANGSLVRDGFRSREVLEALDLCLSCKACGSDCPAGVDMATYKAEVLHHAYRGRLRPANHYALGQLPRWARLAGMAPRLVNSLLRPALIRSRLLRLGGMDVRRGIPRFAPVPLRRATRTRRLADPAERPESGGPPRVVLWADTFTDAFSPTAGHAVIEVLQAAGYEVVVPSRTACCGLTWISTGQLDAARIRLRRTLDILAPFVSAGLPIVGIEPSCTAVLRQELPDLLPEDPRSGTVSAAVRTLAEILTEQPGRKDRWRPPRLDGITVIAQPHCHQHAVMGFETDRRLLNETGAKIEILAGCCGLAGNFGMERGHYDISVAVAERSLLPAVRQRSPGTVLLADGFSCRTQAEQLAGVQGVHLAELLAAHLHD
ncbi:FAD-binding and (Fe-S)-binding domain-containing protein [Plantactinospora sp. KBS50]|uniref:FAD-binding and (Fe-S)-binding domain-containing protein n=1 Tax=Plantactinospora sp. KBS50 TaxID=2024580 RepID=UPI000BAAA814|nr:FAD-binding and (Fe-S)-binding domain-containing protein [Plantactinospora sp. KBS50]ASW53128.1 FAD-binding oxidoreductase [Plantactinospora sp. KBS50]